MNSELLQADSGMKARRRRETLAKYVLLGGALFSMAALAVLLVRLLMDGLPYMDVAFWTNKYSPLGIRRGDSGILDSLFSSVVILAMTMLFAVPVGTAAGIYLYEYAPRNRLTDWIRATVSNLAGVPSVVYGLLGLAIFVRLMADVTGRPSGATNLAAALTLGVLILPILIVSTEEALKTVPDSVRQASLGLGATKWQTIRHHVLPYALPGVLTGQVLALSRAAGETAPLLVIMIPTYTTILGFGPFDVGTPLQVRAYSLAQDSRRAAIEDAGAAIVVLLLATLLLNLAAIALRHRLSKKIKW